jgi:hypothetical protein
MLQAEVIALQGTYVSIKNMCSARLALGICCGFYTPQSLDKDVSNVFL